MFKKLSFKGEYEFFDGMEIEERIKISDFYFALDMEECDGIDQRVFSALDGFFKYRNSCTEGVVLIQNLKSDAMQHVLGVDVYDSFQTS